MSLPDSLKFADKTLTIEITHREAINGLEYFVFSDADYAFPPLPDFFWGGKKVRLSDEGFLFFRWHGRDLLAYDFSHLGTPHEYIGTLPSGSSDTAEIKFKCSYRPNRLSSVLFSFGYDTEPFPSYGASYFLQGYGFGPAYLETLGFEGAHVFYHNLWPISATIGGEEIVYEQVRSFYHSRLESSGLGQVGQVQLNGGFDFSTGKDTDPYTSESYPYNDLIFDVRYSFFGGIPLGDILTGLLLLSETGVADLGKIDFGVLISNGIPPNLQLEPLTEVHLIEGHTYVVWSHEGGVAILYVFEVIRDLHFSSGPPTNVDRIKFDWFYYPDGLPDMATAVQPISWGQLKHRTSGQRS